MDVYNHSLIMFLIKQDLILNNYFTKNILFG